MHAQNSKLRKWSLLATSLVAAVFLLQGCGGGSSGGGDTAATTPTTTPTTSTGTVTGAPAVTTGPLVTIPSSPTAAQAASVAATEFVPVINKVEINSPPKITFSLKDSQGNRLAGMCRTTKAATATVGSSPNISFTLAKLVPGTNGSPSKWVSYLVTTVPTTATAVATGTRPSSDSNGTMVDNGDGTCTYTFYRDITKVKDQIAAMTFTAPSVGADLGDLTYDPNAIHRLGMIISGNVPGTGTNTLDTVQVTTAVPLAKPLNLLFDFIPATGKVLTSTDAGQRLIVDKASCNECHGKLGGIPGTESAAFHGGNRYDPNLCVTCHTDQRKFGQARAVSTNGSFPALTKTVSATGSVSYSPTTYVADGVTIGDFPVLIHRVHKGEMLIKKNYNYANVLLNETKFPQDIRNCTKCHDDTAPKVAPQASNYKNVPSRLACGACHDGIDFATGQGTTNAGATTGHIGGAKADDKLCVLCHDATTIPLYHIAVTPPNPANILVTGGTNNNTNAAWIASNDKNLPAGAIKVTYDIKSVSRNASKQPTMTFRMLQNGVAAPFNTYSATGKTEMWDNFMGSPSAYFVFSVPQDGIAAPADFNASASGYLRSIWNGKATGTSAGTLVADPANPGYYIVTLTGVIVPDSAKMLTGGLGYTYGLQTTMPLTQTNLAKYPVAAATNTAALTAGMPNKTGGLIVIAEDAQMVATGYTGRRAIVEDKRCNACHEELGAFTEESFHAGQRNDGTTCSWCHNPNRTSSAWAADSTAFIHAIHAGAKRTTKFTWHAATTTSSYADIGYPGILSKCETCHLPGTYDFSASASASALPNRLYRYVATGGATPLVTSTSTDLVKFSTSPYVTSGTAYGAGFAFNASATAASNVTKKDGTVFSNPAQGIFNAEDTTLVNSPIAAACFACHDSSLAQAHMTSNGGSIYAARGAALAKAEQCTLCHATGKVADIATMHAK